MHTIVSRKQNLGRKGKTLSGWEGLLEIVRLEKLISNKLNTCSTERLLSLKINQLRHLFISRPIEGEEERAKKWLTIGWLIECVRFILPDVVAGVRVGGRRPYFALAPLRNDDVDDDKNRSQRQPTLTTRTQHVAMHWTDSTCLFDAYRNRWISCKSSELSAVAGASL